MSPLIELNELIYQLRRNYPNHPSTFSPCSMDECGNPARGGGKCAECCTVAIGELTGMPDEANQLHAATLSTAILLGDLTDAVEE